MTRFITASRLIGAVLACLLIPCGPAGAQQPLVELHVAVADAETYERVMALLANARLTAHQGEAFLVVGAFADARQAYAFGRSLQRRLQLPFELVYEPGHPQADLAWSRSQPSPNRDLRVSPHAISSGSPVQQPVTPGPLAEAAGIEVPESLIYLYASPANEAQDRELAKWPLPPGAPRAADAQGRVRLGVFRDTKVGRRLLEAQLSRLQALGVSHEQVLLEPMGSLAGRHSDLPLTISAR